MEPLDRFVLAAAVVAGGVSAAAGAGDLLVAEPGFTVMQLDPGVGAKQAECSPGGIWGDFVYVADSQGDRIDRIAYGEDTMSIFATGVDFPVGLAFGPGPGADFGDFLLSANFGDGTIRRVSPDGVTTPFVELAGAPASATFDPLGGYGDDLFVVLNAFSGPIATVDAKGDVAPFSDLPSAYIKFGPGGAWGTGLYATSHGPVPGLARVDPNGDATPLAEGLVGPEGFDWAFGSIFAGDLFATDVTEGEIHRIRPDGARTLWARLAAAADVAFCDGALYVVSGHGGCYKVTVACAADVDRTGTVDFIDLLLVLDGWGDGDGRGDVDGDRSIDFEDIILVLDAWGPCP